MRQGGAVLSEATFSSDPIYLIHSLLQDLLPQGLKHWDFTWCGLFVHETLSQGVRGGRGRGGSKGKGEWKEEEWEEREEDGKERK